jgi:hypothetical protein
MILDKDQVLVAGQQSGLDAKDLQLGDIPAGRVGVALERALQLIGEVEPLTSADTLNAAGASLPRPPPNTSSGRYGRVPSTVRLSGAPRGRTDDGAIRPTWR